MVTCALCIFMLPWVGLCSVYLPHVAIGWSVFCVSSSRCHGLVCALCIFLTLHGLVCVLCIFLTLPCSVYLPQVAMGWSVYLPHVAMGWSVFCVSSSRYHGLVCVLCIFLTVPWVGLWSVYLLTLPFSVYLPQVALDWSVYLPHVAMSWSVLSVSSSRCHGLVCNLCIFLTLLWVGLCSVYLPHVAWVDLKSVYLPQVTWVGMCSVYLPHVTWVDLCSVYLPHVAMGWSMLCVSSSRCMG